ncbi:Kiwa anti-phage protein KwaB-like domain-containing protein [Sporanaerobium hydrogeniformans]|uniref:Kiwa anti-phage protein KwaB-like domain-containing protein n=1 Tax=Sporanaerobium hydrogeniformans TaxID=3072179 RepID=UPI00117B737A
MIGQSFGRYFILIRLDGGFQFFSLSNQLFIKDLDKLERSYRFQDVIKKKAINSINS